MKYYKIKYRKINTISTINVKNYSLKQFETMKVNGDFICPFKDCNAKLCLVHNSKDGGRTYFFKAIDDEQHIKDCQYKNINNKEISKSIDENAFFSVGQVNASVRALYYDYTRQKEVNKKKKGETYQEKGIKKIKSNRRTTNIKKTSSKGKITNNNENFDGVKGRLRRRLHITNEDIGHMAKVCGTVLALERNSHNELFIKFKEERLKNIRVFIGPVYENNNPKEYKSLNLLEEYFIKKSKNKEVILAAGGLVNIHNELLVLERNASHNRPMG